MIIEKTFDELGELVDMESISYTINKRPDMTKQNKTVAIEKNTTNNLRYLTVPIQRFSENYKVIMLDNDEYTICRLLRTIYTFYNKVELSLEDLKNINEDDVYDYVATQTKLKKENPTKKIYYIDLMADKIFLEGIYKKVDKSGDTQYYLLLGS